MLNYYINSNKLKAHVILEDAHEVTTSSKLDKLILRIKVNLGIHTYNEVINRCFITIKPFKTSGKLSVTFNFYKPITTPSKATGIFLYLMAAKSLIQLKNELNLYKMHEINKQINLSQI